MTDNELISELESDLKKAFEIIRCQKTEIDILIRKKETLRDEIADLQHKIKVLEGENLVFKGGVEYFKSEAIKEFAERLKKEATVDDDSIWWIAGVDIDKVLKEMVGDTE